MAPRFSHGGLRRARGRDRRPRRRETPYRLTPARRAAGIRNLRRANLARKLKPYRFSLGPEGLAKALANLKLADAARPLRWDGARHGLYSALLPEAMRRAGESPEELEAHVGRFVRALSAGPDAAAQDELSLVRAAAELVWRHVRAFRRLGEWERAGVRKLVARFDGYPVSEALRENLAFQLVEFLEGSTDKLSVPLGRLRRRLERVLGALYLGRFGSDPGFEIFGSRWSLLVEAGASPEIVSSPTLSRWQVWRVRNNHEERLERESAEAPRGAGGAPGASASSRLVLYGPSPRASFRAPRGVIPSAARNLLVAREMTKQVPRADKNLGPRNDVPIVNNYVGRPTRPKEQADWRPFFRRIFAVSERPEDGRVKRAAGLFEEAVARRLKVFPLEARRQAREVREIMEGAGVAAPLSEPDTHAVLLRVLRLLGASDGVFDDLPGHEDRLQAALVEWLETPCRRPE
jgi:hypothetical protein